MNIKKCENGHFYDSDKHTACPHCAEKKKQELEQKEEKKLGLETVEYKPAVESASPWNQNNIQMMQPSVQNGLVIGWIVAVSGLEYGKFYPLYTSDNYVGSGYENTISIIGDPYVLPDHHCVISFDLQTRKVVLNLELSTGEIVINGISATESCYLNHRDMIQIGGSVYTFIELCRDGFSWWTNMTARDIERKEIPEIKEIDTAFSEQSNGNNQIDLGAVRREMHSKQRFKTLMDQTVLNYADPYDDVYEQSEKCADDEVAETSVLVSQEWRCPSCNGRNSEFADVCRLCGARRH